MMGERATAQVALFYEVSLERHVPAHHLLRSIDRFVDLSGRTGVPAMTAKSSRLEIDALETGKQRRAIMEALEPADVDPEGITAALLPSAFILRRKHHASSRVLPQLIQAAEWESGGIRRPQMRVTSDLRPAESTIVVAIDCRLCGKAAAQPDLERG